VVSEDGRMKVRVAGTTDIEACVELLGLLPDYFTPETYGELRSSMTSPRSIAMVGEADEAIVAFVHAVIRYDQSAEITHAAVRPDQRNQGVGTSVLGAILEALEGRGVAIVQVKTLDASSGYAPYDETRAFWEARGFVQIDCIDPLPGWDPGNPSAIYVKAIRPT
jgi:ribosomal protein S18 acetylase RimI-like enzyme